MSQWNKSVETAIRALGDYFDKQTRDILDTKRSVFKSSLSCGFRAVAFSNKHVETLHANGIEYKNWVDCDKLIALAKANNSDAADKLEKMLPVAHQLQGGFAVTGKSGAVERVKFAKFAAKMGVITYK